MTFEVETGTGSPTATSYASVDYADEYIAKMYGEDPLWDDLDSEDKETALEVATVFIDRLLRWNSYIKVSDQALAFPRKAFKDVEGRTVSGDSVPKVIVDYTVEFAFQKAKGTLTKETTKLISESFGNSSETYAAPLIISGSPVVHDATTDLIYLGYGRSKVTLATLWRA